MVRGSQGPCGVWWTGSSAVLGVSGFRENRGMPGRPHGWHGRVRAAVKTDAVAPQSGDGTPPGTGGAGVSIPHPAGCKGSRIRRGPAGGGI